MKLKTNTEGTWVYRDPPLLSDDRKKLLQAMRGVRKRPSSGAEWAHHSVYVALLAEVPGDPPLSFYVGMSGLSPEERYLRHLAGIQAGKKRIMRFGLGLLPNLYERFNPMSDPDAREVELELSEAIGEAGFRVHSA